MPRWFKTTGVASSIILTCFFLPWVMVSCGNQEVVSVSGWRLAAGGEVDTAMGTQSVQASPELFLVLIAAIGCLVLAYVAYRNNSRINLALYGSAALAAASLLDFWIRLSQLNSETQKAGLDVSSEAGFWGTLLGNVVIIGATLYEIRQQPRLAVGESSTGAPRAPSPSPIYPSVQQKPPPQSASSPVVPENDKSSQADTDARIPGDFQVSFESILLDADPSRQTSTQNAPPVSDSEIWRKFDDEELK